MTMTIDEFERRVRELPKGDWAFIAFEDLESDSLSMGVIALPADSMFHERRRECAEALRTEGTVGPAVCLCTYMGPKGDDQDQAALRAGKLDLAKELAEYARMMLAE